MALASTLVGNYTVFAPAGKLTVSEALSLTPEFTRHLQSYPDRSIALDLSRVEYLDSSAIRLLLNLKKHTDQHQTHFILISPSKSVTDLFSTTNLTKVFLILESIADLQARSTAEESTRYEACCHLENGLKRLNVTCDVCGSSATMGYLVEPTLYHWEWLGDSLFPHAYEVNTKRSVDVFGLQPIICMDCFFCSTDISLFTAHSQDNSSIRIPSRLSPSEKSLLAKATKRRKGMLEHDTVVHDHLFLHPRTPAACYNLYLLAENCAQTVAVGKGVSGAFAAGFMSYMVLQYANGERAALQLDNCRTWLTKALATTGGCSPFQRAQAFFILIAAATELDKPKEETMLRNQFALLMQAHPQTLPSNTLTSIAFWHQQSLVLGTQTR